MRNMNNLIRRFNEIQEINKELKIEAMKLPQIVVIGSQSSGKSSVLESIVGSDFFPKGKGMITRCPLRLELLNGCVNGSDFQAIFNHRDTVITTYNEISREIKKETDKRTTNAKTITDDELVLEIMGPQFPTLTLVDLPGLIQNLENDQPKNLDNQIKDLMRKYIEPENSIILAVSPANVDLATSEIVRYAKEVDPRGSRTIHVLTKLDIMNEGENAQDPLKCDYLRPSIEVIGVINRNERDVQRSLSINDQRAKEEKFFLEKYPDLAAKHGTMYLLKILEKVLTQSIQKFIPIFEDVVKINIRKYKKELENLDPKDKRVLVTSYMNKFCDMYSRTLTGDLSSYGNDLEGGALISRCLYEIFYGEMIELNVAQLSDEFIHLTIRNTAGTKDMSLSFKKPFDHLIRLEIEKCKEPCNVCINSVEEKLNDFVNIIVDKIELFDYPKVADSIKTIACEIIAERSEKVRGMIQDFITAEIEDVTFTNPFGDILKNFNNFPQVSKHRDQSENTVITPNMLKEIIKLIGLNLSIESYYPHINMAVVAFGWTSKLKLAYDNQKFNEVINTVNDVIDKGIGLEPLKDKINENLLANMEAFMLRFKADTDIEAEAASKDGILMTQATIIKNLMCLYFEMIRGNIINFVPKTIQTFLISRIWEQMLQRIQIDLLQEKHLDYLICSDSDVQRVENLRNDLEKSLEMHEKLKRLRGLNL